MIPPKGGKERKQNEMKKRDTFTTCQALAAVAVFAQKQLKKGEDVRKLYPMQGTGDGARWQVLVIAYEICKQETGELIREEYAEVYKSYYNHTAKITVCKF